MDSCVDERRPLVVLVGDPHDFRAVVRHAVVSAGFDVVAEGQDGDEGIVLSHRYQPNLMLLDV